MILRGGLPNRCYGVSITGQMKRAVNTGNPNPADSSPCISPPETTMSVSVSCLQDAPPNTSCSGRKYLNHGSLPWISWHSLILGHTRVVVVWSRRRLAHISLVGSANPGAHKVSVSKSLVTDVNGSCDIYLYLYLYLYSPLSVVILPQEAKDCCYSWCGIDFVISL